MNWGMRVARAVAVMALALVTACRSSKPAAWPHPSDDGRETLTLAEARADLAVFLATLHEAHPGYYRYTPRDSFARLEKSVGSALSEGMTRIEFYRTLYPIYAAIRDGHTKFYPSEKEGSWIPFNGDRLIPLVLHVDGRRAWILEDVSRTVPPGAEVISIDGLPVSGLIDDLLPRAVFSDGWGTERNSLELGRHFAAYHAAFIGAADSYELSLRGASEALADLSFVTVPAVDERKLLEARSLQDRPDPLGFEVREDGTAILRIGLFSKAGLKGSFPGFLRDAFSRIRREGIGRLVIDLRDNEGGTDAYGALLYSYLADAPFRYYDRIETSAAWSFTTSRYMRLPWYFPLYRMFVRANADGAAWNHHRNLRMLSPRPDAFRGSLAVVSNGRSFSVTSEFLSAVRTHKRGIVVGTESGGAYGGNTSGIFWAIATLPHSRLAIGIPTWSYYLRVDPVQPLDRGILPDVEVRPSIEDLLSGRDPVLEEALEAVASTG